jgi:hypothetical protein
MACAIIKVIKGPIKDAPDMSGNPIFTFFATIASAKAITNGLKHNSMESRLISHSQNLSAGLENSRRPISILWIIFLISTCFFPKTHRSLARIDKPSP